jgi:hypothetical protein
MAKKVSPAMRAGILSGLVASMLFIYFIDPILSLVGRFVLHFASKLHLLYLDRLYSELATGDIDHAYLLHNLIIVLAIGFITGLWTSVIYIYKHKKTTEEEKSDSEKDLTSYSIGKVVAAFFFSLIIVVVLLLDLVDSHIRLKTSTSYNQYLTIVSPHINDIEFKTLKAQYASMKSKKDYDNLLEHINSIAKANGITLPDNKLYPFF